MATLEEFKALRDGVPAEVDNEMTIDIRAVQA